MWNGTKKVRTRKEKKQKGKPVRSVGVKRSVVPSGVRLQETKENRKLEKQNIKIAKTNPSLRVATILIFTSA